MAKRGLKRLQLHARRLAFTHPATGDALALAAPLPQDMGQFVERQLALRPDRI
jgi:23S rRNA pseudouridine955/2504/2580 synthase